jgi:hypothetical protein
MSHDVTLVIVDCDFPRQSRPKIALPRFNGLFAPSNALAASLNGAAETSPAAVEIYRVRSADGVVSVGASPEVPDAAETSR